MAEEYQLLPDEIKALVTEQQFLERMESRGEAFFAAHLIILALMKNCVCAMETTMVEIRDILQEIADEIDD